MKTIQKYLGSEFVLRASLGHVKDLVSTPKNRLGVDIENDFKPSYAVIPEKKDKIGAIMDAVSQVSQIYLASDPDREGEAIAFHIADLLKTDKPVHRVHFHEITKKGVNAGIANLMKLDKNLYDAQQARRVLDRLVGFMVSPFIMECFGPSLSAGRVQSVAVRLVVDREREIENFKPEEYWSITTALAKPTKLTDSFIAKFVNKVTNKTDATKIKSDLEKDTFEIIEVVAEEKKRTPFPPLTTSKLQQAASAKYGIPAARTMKAAQSLYESGVVTYIRTDSVRCSPDSISSVRDWLAEAGYDVPKKPNFYATKGAAQDAHEAIRPTDVSRQPAKFGGSEDEQKVYTLIWERFVASQMEPAVYDTLAVTVRSSSGHILKANGRVLKYQGWLAVTADFDSSEDNDVKLPSLEKGDVVVLVPPRVKAEQKFTQPPPRYNDGSMVKELEKRGIGRPSTYATIMTKITDRAYVEKKKNTFFATDLGKKVVDKLVQYFSFMEYKYTADLEEKLDQIGQGELSYLAMLNNFFPDFKNQMEKAYSSGETDYGIQCSKCGKAMRLKHGKFGYYMSCNDYQTCKTNFSCDLVDGKPVFKDRKKVETVNGVACAKCSAGMIIRDGKFGKFYSCSKYPKCNGSAKIPFGKKCGKCGTDMHVTIFSGENKLACMGYPACKNIEPLPSDAKVDWVDPKTIQTKRRPRSVEKVLKPNK